MAQTIAIYLTCFVLSFVTRAYAPGIPIIVGPPSPTVVYIDTRPHSESIIIPWLKIDEAKIPTQRPPETFDSWLFTKGPTLADRNLYYDKYKNLKSIEDEINEITEEFKNRYPNNFNVVDKDFFNSAIKELDELARLLSFHKSEWLRKPETQRGDENGQIFRNIHLDIYTIRTMMKAAANGG